jgi:hypothetical protein
VGGSVWGRKKVSAGAVLFISSLPSGYPWPRQATDLQGYFLFSLPSLFPCFTSAFKFFVVPENSLNSQIWQNQKLLIFQKCEITWSFHYSSFDRIEAEIDKITILPI